MAARRGALYGAQEAVAEWEELLYRAATDGADDEEEISENEDKGDEDGDGEMIGAAEAEALTRELWRPIGAACPPEAFLDDGAGDGNAGDGSGGGDGGGDGVLGAFAQRHGLASCGQLGLSR